MNVVGYKVAIRAFGPPWYPQFYMNVVGYKVRKGKDDIDIQVGFI